MCICRQGYMCEKRIREIYGWKDVNPSDNAGNFEGVEI